MSSLALIFATQKFSRFESDFFSLIFQRKSQNPPVTKFHKLFTLAHVRPFRFSGKTNLSLSDDKRSNPHTKKCV